MNTIFGVCFVLRNRLDIPKIKHSKDLEEKINQSSREKSEMDNLYKYHKYKVTKPSKADKSLNLSSMNDTLYLNNSTFAVN
jgi:hypothetical protein